jgi:CRISPR-associated protein Cas5t
VLCCSSAAVPPPPCCSPPHTQPQAAGEPNAAHLAREGDALRATKTSSASLIRASGKAGQQVVLRPAHLSFGSLTAGSMAHRTARLLNGSPDLLRYTVLRPQLPLKWVGGAVG